MTDSYIVAFVLVLLVWICLFKKQKNSLACWAEERVIMLSGWWRYCSICLLGSFHMAVENEENICHGNKNTIYYFFTKVHEKMKQKYSANNLSGLPLICSPSGLTASSVCSVFVTGALLVVVNSAAELLLTILPTNFFSMCVARAISSLIFCLHTKY